MNLSQFISDYPVILAPMSGITDFPFRALVKNLGAGLLVSEMIASRGMIKQTKDSLQKSHIQSNTAVQLAGCDPLIMAEAAKLNEDMGAQIIDINFGCPVKKVVNSYAGSALMKDEITAAKILEAVVKAVKVPVTLKMRIGWDSQNLNSPRLAKIAENTGIKMITIHGRTRAQMFTGKADWKFISNIKKCVRIPIIVNGDIKTLDDIKIALEESQADGIMIGRGAYGKPWIINKALQFIKSGIILPDPTVSEKLQIIINHYDNIIEHYGKDIGVKISKKHIGWYSACLENSTEFRSKVNCSNNHQFIRDQILNFFSPK
ncbi:nitrogen regulation protein nifR3 [Ehrlichia ruminantium]|uniref:tRNA dihydrouridine synthase DusB n=1 Tax=Ehrlichia ruminantium TaxID=779 RepID=UPI00004C77A0|nr:tRNA dihydrouridine synthase DusB [Ehrlichia ruminantium]QLK52258.1 tRNA dihydrouridine synthase DusB [Ehrlichia ruminantium]QLK54089.1 tRNA dihydrouridine synthase DusB [Ehrlichia ruminantium]QLK56840.1 tRNA dihydrouridine synthase DusB [Ehrlichia ruminantium]QLK57752.1 tRNA dihydrouridine synthase DusB [Ehrlichia ruminantium]QLK58671.1 tRNA dihydrouridine synthase DusB [Ehrlichia ruminantium]